MQEVNQTKVQLIRQAVEENLPRGPHSKIPPAVPQRRRRPWLPAVPVGVLFIFLVSAAVVSTESSPETNSAAVAPRSASPSGENEDSHATIEPPDKAPRPMDRAMFPLSIRRIVLDPGHGGEHEGAVSRSGLREKDFTLQIAMRLRRLLKEQSFEVLMTRETDSTVELDKRAGFANENHGDLFVSIHINSVPYRKLHPLETFFLGPTDDPQITKLVALENRDSGYSLSEYRNLLEKTYLDARRDESRRLAQSVHNELYRSVRRVNPAVQDRGVKTAPFVVLIRTEMPAILVEVSCVSNEQEVKLLTTDSYQENIARALMTGIQSYANDLSRAEDKIANNGTNQ